MAADLERLPNSRGAIDEEVESESQAFDAGRKFLSYLPWSIYDMAPRGPITDDPNRRDEWLINAIPRDRHKVYRMRPIIESVVDKGSFTEIGGYNGRSITTAPLIACAALD
jgi:acetyl-CoA carboxylase carboxyltransferase component